MKQLLNKIKCLFTKKTQYYTIDNANKLATLKIYKVKARVFIL